MAQTPVPRCLRFSEGDLWERVAQFSQLVKRHAAGDHTRDNAVPEESPRGRSQTLKTDRLRQQQLRKGQRRDLA
jgi:hypothetical protein